MTLRILSFTTLYPNAAQPTHGVFVENRLRRLVESGQAAVTMVSPVPWFPFKGDRFGRYSTFAKVPREERLHGIDIYHPRFLTIPKLGMNMAPTLMYQGVRAFMQKLVQEHGAFDVLDAHYFYPDGVAAARLAKDLDLPVTVTARGTDLSLIPNFANPRQQITKAAETADAIITVCDALQRPLIELGIDPGKITTIRNGVDLDIFSPQERTTAREKWGVTGTTIVSVGRLDENKGQHLTIEALTKLPDVNFLIAGGGTEEANLKALAQRLGVADRVHFLGMVPHEELASLCSAADISVLASAREGWANVLLESMACGTPVVATDIWGTAEVVQEPAAGLLVKDRSAVVIATSIRNILSNMPDRADTRAYAEKFSWDETTEAQLALFGQLAAHN